MFINRLFLLYLVVLFASSAHAATQTFSGYFNDQTNTSLVASDLSSPIFGSDPDIANNVAVYSLNIASAGIITFHSLGFSQGGVDPYFTLFQGNGNAATFLGSNYDQAFLGTGGDFLLTFNLSSGNYMIALGSFANMSFAENNPTTGTLADGFTGLGYDTGTSTPYYYELAVSTRDVTAVPEPCSILLLAVGLLGFTTSKKRKCST